MLRTIHVYFPFLKHDQSYNNQKIQVGLSKKNNIKTTLRTKNKTKHWSVIFTYSNNLFCLICDLLFNPDNSFEVQQIQVNFEDSPVQCDLPTLGN